MQLTKQSKMRSLKEIRNTTSQPPRQFDEDSAPRRNLGVFLNTTEDSQKFSEKYRIKNIGELRNLLTKQTD